MNTASHGTDDDTVGDQSAQAGNVSLNNERGEVELNTLPPHVQAFSSLLIEHSAAVRAKNADQEKEIAERITRFAAEQGLTEEQVEDLRHFVRQGISGKVINDERSATHSGITRTLHWPARLMKIAADTIPQLCQETVRLALSAVGLSVAGATQAAITTWQALTKVLRRAT